MNVIIVALEDTRRDVTNTTASTKKIQKVDGAETDVSKRIFAYEILFNS